MSPLFSIGRILTGIAYLLLGFVHFKFGIDDEKMVPAFLPNALLWVYLAGICWFATGASFILNLLVRASGLLSALLVFIIVFSVQLKGLSSGISAMGIITLAFSLGLIAASLMIASSGKSLIKRQNVD